MILSVPLSHESLHESLLGKEYDGNSDTLDEDLETPCPESEYLVEES